MFKQASATKFITSVALLQCIESGLLTLDEPLTKILPEFNGKEILHAATETDFVSSPSTVKLTARHLLTHTSGLGYKFLHPLLTKWGNTPEGIAGSASQVVPIRYNTPLIFEPGTGWQYGSSIDWAGCVVRRLHNNMSLEEYFIENIFKPLGCSAPFPTFALSQHPDYEVRLLQGANRPTPDGHLTPIEFTQGNNTQDQEGGSGLCSTARDFLLVLADLISDSPKLLKPSTIDQIFTPQLTPGSKHTDMLIELKMAWETVAGPVDDKDVNHGLVGLLVLGEAEEIGQPKNVLAWGGAYNTFWFACREKGVAGFFGTQITPYGDPAVRELVNGWKRDFWKGFKGVA